MSEWETMDTAPQDGTRILLWDKRRDVVVSGCWHVEPEVNDPRSYEPGWAWWCADDDLIVWDDDTGPDLWAHQEFPS